MVDASNKDGSSLSFNSGSAVASSWRPPSLWRPPLGFTTRNVAICDDLLVTLLTFVTEWYVIYDETSIFVIGAK
jgi:hypothetical protein